MGNNRLITAGARIDVINKINRLSNMAFIIRTCHEIEANSKISTEDAQRIGYALADIIQDTSTRASMLMLMASSINDLSAAVVEITKPKEG